MLFLFFQEIKCLSYKTKEITEEDCNGVILSSTVFNYTMDPNQSVCAKDSIFMMGRDLTISNDTTSVFEAIFASGKLLKIQSHQYFTTLNLTNIPEPYINVGEGIWDDIEYHIDQYVYAKHYWKQNITTTIIADSQKKKLTIYGKFVYFPLLVKATITPISSYVFNINYMSSSMYTDQEQTNIYDFFSIIPIPKEIYEFGKNNNRDTKNYPNGTFTGYAVVDIEFYNHDDYYNSILPDKIIKVEENVILGPKAYDDFNLGGYHDGNDDICNSNYLTFENIVTKAHMAKPMCFKPFYYKNNYYNTIITAYNFNLSLTYANITIDDPLLIATRPFGATGERIKIVSDSVQVINLSTHFFSTLPSYENRFNDIENMNIEKYLVHQS